MQFYFAILKKIKYSLLNICSICLLIERWNLRYLISVKLILKTWYLHLRCWYKFIRSRYKFLFRKKKPLVEGCNLITILSKLWNTWYINILERPISYCSLQGSKCCARR